MIGGLGCGEGDPVGSDDAGQGDCGLSVADAMPPADASPSCLTLASDYNPRVNSSADDQWPACISDDNQYHRFDDSISSVARVAAFEAIAALLVGGCPSPQAFIDARVIYQEASGLDSRVARREDEHYPAAPLACRDMTAAELASYPDRCVGPARILPLLSDAFAAGAVGAEPERNAARIEAGLLWFLYTSVYKEATTCTEVVNDCDSHYAYYGGGFDRSGGTGLARYLSRVSPQSHDRVWDGILAVRCWRDLDNPAGIAADLAMRDRALAQLDAALLHGLASVVRDRVVALSMSSGEAARAHLAFAQVLGAVLDREASLRDASAAAQLRGELAKSDPSAVDQGIISAALSSLFPCP